MGRVHPTRKGLRRATVAGAVGLLAALSWTPGWAGPPLATDDPATIGPGNVELIVALTRQEAASAVRSQAPLLDLTVGVAPDLDLLATLPWAVVDEPSRGARSGLGRLAAGAKWRFWRDETRALSAAFTPVVDFRTPLSSDDSSLASKGAAVTLPVELERARERWRAGTELGCIVRAKGGDTCFAGLAGGLRVVPAVELVAELVGGARAEDFGATRLGWSAGADVTLLPWLHLLVAAGRDLPVGSGARTHLTLYAGLQLVID